MRAVSVLLGAAALLAGCAGAPLLSQREEAPRFRDPALTVPQAAQWLAPGRATRQEVLERLGPGEALRFDTGYEVRVWRARGARDARAAPELVVLFDPGGLVHKVRARPAYATPSP
jgi:hypothetical protein